VLLGRSAAKGEAAKASLAAQGPGTAEFLAVDLSTHAGVRAAAEAIAKAHPKLDGLLLGQGVLMMRDERTADGLHPILAVNYLSRYHLTQLLLPQLKAAEKPTVVLLVAGVPVDSKIDFNLFPKFEGGFPGMSKLSSIQIANYHYVKHLAVTQPWLRAAVVNVGLVSTDIMRDMPALVRLVIPVVALFTTIPVERSAANPVWLLTHADWPSGEYWPKPGKTELHVDPPFDPAVTDRVVASSRDLAGI